MSDAEMEGNEEAMSAQDTQQAASAQHAGEPARKKGRKKWPIVTGVVVVVLAAAGAGFWAWHETPSFCGAICHVSMDAYYETYADGSTDKYGNELADETSKTAMMAYLHGTYTSDGEQVSTGSGMGCMSCHTPVISEQVSEGIHWLTGDYDVMGPNSNGDYILEERSLSDLVAARGSTEDEFCLNSGCHTNDDGSVMTRDDLVEATADLSETRNPHVSQHGEYSCTQCHKGHTQSTNYCSSCHTDAPIPDGWLSYDEYEETATL